MGWKIESNERWIRYWPITMFIPFYNLLIVHSFVEFVQVLPTQNDSPLCGLMNDGLLRGINLLQQLTLSYKDASPLERYAVFTAAALRDVANVVVNQKVFITDEEGATAKVWEPFEGSLESDQEAELSGKNIFYAHDFSKEKIDEIVSLLGEKVYITVDVDGFDPSVMPGTGTPEPGGLFWNDVISIMKAVAKKKQVVGFDVVEVMPVPPLQITEFTAAKLVYKMIGYFWGK